jgi:hypothetical protein
VAAVPGRHNSGGIHQLISFVACDPVLLQISGGSAPAESVGYSLRLAGGQALALEHDAQLLVLLCTGPNFHTVVASDVGNPKQQ